MTIREAIERLETLRWRAEEDESYWRAHKISTLESYCRGSKQAFDIARLLLEELKGGDEK